MEHIKLPPRLAGQSLAGYLRTHLNLCDAFKVAGIPGQQLITSLADIGLPTTIGNLRNELSRARRARSRGKRQAPQSIGASPAPASVDAGPAASIQHQERPIFAYDPERTTGYDHTATIQRLAAEQLV